MGRPFHIPTEEKCECGRNKIEGNLETYLESTTPREPFDTGGITFSAHLRTLQRDRKKRRGTRELSCPLVTMWGYPCFLQCIQNRRHLQLLWMFETCVEEISSRKCDLFPGRGEWYVSGE